MLTVSEADLGTPEARWSEAPQLLGMPSMAWGNPARVVVVAPHPDDEVLAVGGAVRDLAAAGAEIVVVAVSDGESSHPGSTAFAPGVLARVRQQERAAALEALGLRDPEVHRLGLPDGSVADHEAELRVALTRLLDAPTLCLATWRHDGHPDHDATGRAARAATASTGATFVEFPVWAWHWADPDDGRLPDHHRSLPWGRARRHELTAGTRDAKVAAITAYRSQIAPIGPLPADRAVLPGPVLDRFRRPFEVVFAAPATL